MNRQCRRDSRSHSRFAPLELAISERATLGCHGSCAAVADEELPDSSHPLAVYANPPAWRSNTAPIQVIEYTVTTGERIHSALGYLSPVDYENQAKLNQLQTVKAA